MKWYYYLIIAAAVLLISMVIIITVATINKKKKSKIVSSYYTDILQAIGGKENVLSVSANGSRLSFTLKDPNQLNKDILQSIHIQGIVRSSKKTTLVIGEMAQQYANMINEELQNK